MNPREILLVEDNLGDIRILQEAFADAGITSRMNVVRSGEEAMDFLYRRGRYGGTPTPDLIVLDLNMPAKDGQTVLQELKADPLLRDIPLAILTSSSIDREMMKTFGLPEEAYIVKPAFYAHYSEVVRSLMAVWHGGDAGRRA
jgi:chemotaxis family two-component system response regulator Rcp1